jgi:hypothetical protein
MADSISCQIVYADIEGSVHLRLPIFVDSTGACHVSLIPGCDLCDDEAGKVLSHVCLGACASTEEERRACLQRCVEKALSTEEDEENAHKAWLKRALFRIRSLSSGSTEEKDALRRALIAQRQQKANEAPVENLWDSSESPRVSTLAKAPLCLS